MEKPILDSVEYKMITTFYGSEKTERSQVPLINHIQEGLQILEFINASEFAKKAYCLHPILQSDESLKQNWKMYFAKVNPKVMLLCMEYRKVANTYLSRVIQGLLEIELSPIKSVNEMLVADKVQNYKDFLKYHAESHPRTKELELYFSNWL
ncbi:MAG: hypothetical protein ACI85I_001499 [Arenicella sp.]|jgi:hypothetical protein